MQTDTLAANGIVPSDEARAREVLAEHLDAAGFTVTAKRVREERALTEQGALFGPALAAMLAFANDRTPPVDREAIADAPLEEVDEVAFQRWYGSVSVVLSDIEGDALRVAFREHRLAALTPASEGKPTESGEARERSASPDMVLDAERFRALMRCPRIKMQGSAGVSPKTGERTYPDQPGRVHFGAEFWPLPARDPTTGEIKVYGDCPRDMTAWGHHALRALADDILAVEAAQPTKSAEQEQGL